MAVSLPRVHPRRCCCELTDAYAARSLFFGYACMNCSICSSLRTVSPAPPRRLRTSFPSFTAFKPKVLSAIPWAWQKADIREIRASVLVMSGMLLGYFPSVKRFNEATFPQAPCMLAWQYPPDERNQLGHAHKCLTAGGSDCALE